MQSKRSVTILISVLVCALLTGIGYATIPSGNGQTTKSKSVSVAIASDQIPQVTISNDAGTALGTSTNPVIVTVPTLSTFTPDVIRSLADGGALATENDPNTTAPDSSVVARFTPARGAVVYGQGGVSVYGVGGTSCVVRLWWYDDTNAVWTAVGGPQTLTTASTNFVGINSRAMVGAKFFVQITTNTGCTKVIWHFS